MTGDPSDFHDDAGPKPRADPGEVVTSIRHDAAPGVPVELGAGDSPAPVHELRIDETLKLAEALSIEFDLAFTVDALGLWLEVIEAAEHDQAASIRARSLWSAAVVSYARAFGGRLRSGGTPILSRVVLADAGDGAIEFHDWILGLRNKHVAHSVNPYEQTRVGIILGEGQPPPVLGIAHLHSTYVGPNRDGVEQFRRLAGWVLAMVRRKRKSFEADALAAADRIGGSAISAKPMLQNVIPGPADATVTRRM